MRSIIASLVFLLLTGSLAAQTPAVWDALAKHGIDTSILKQNMRANQADLAFDLRYSTITNEQEKIVLAKFDPSLPGDNKWTVISVNGKAPSGSDIKRFNKEHAKPPITAAQADPNSMRIEKESDTALVISYTFDLNTLPEEGKFLKDCRSFLSIDLRTKRLVKLQTVNEKPVKIKILNAEKLDVTVQVYFDETLKRYLPKIEDVVLVVKLLGQSTSIETISEYSNYTKK